MSGHKSVRKNPDINKVLVVGPNGNVGSHLIPRLLELGYGVRALQFRTPVTPVEGMEVIQGSTLEPESLPKALEGVDAVCHMIRDAPGKNFCDSWFNTCLRGTVNLLEAARQVPLKRFINGSADNVYGHTTIRHVGPIHENSPKRFADSFYGLFKIAEEEILRQYTLGFDVPTVVTCFPLIWMENSPPSINGCCTLDEKRKLVRMRLDVDGKPQVRHDIYITDAVQGILLALEHDQAVGENFLFAGPAPICAKPMAEAICESMGYTMESFQGDWHSWTVDDSKARSILGYRPTIDVMDTFRKGISRS